MLIMCFCPCLFGAGILTPSHLPETHIEPTDDQIAQIEAFCDEVCKGLDNATFEDQQRYIALLDVRGTLAIEDGEKVVYATCKIGKQRLLQIPTSPSSESP